MSTPNVRILLGLPAEAPETLLFDDLTRRHYELPAGLSYVDTLRGVLQRVHNLPDGSDGALLLAQLRSDLNIAPEAPPLDILHAYIRWREGFEADDELDVDSIVASAAEQLGVVGADNEVLLGCYLRDNNNLALTATNFQTLFAWLRVQFTADEATIRDILVSIVSLEIGLSWENPEDEVVERLVRTLASVGPTAPLSEVAEGWYRRRCGRELTGPEVVVEAVKGCLCMDPASSPDDVVVQWIRSQRFDSELPDEEAFLDWLRGEVTFPEADSATPEEIKAAWLMMASDDWAHLVDDKHGFIGRAYHDFLDYWRQRVKPLHTGEASDIDVLDAALRLFDGLPLEASCRQAFAAAVMLREYETDRIGPHDDYVDVVGAIVRSDLNLKDDDPDTVVLDVLLGD